MKKTYCTPKTEVIRLAVGQPMLLPVSGSSTEIQWAPEAPDAPGVGTLPDTGGMENLLFQ
ncbi:MAG: hypothetical protein IJ614_03360 [Prevotella sp.]|nr:hypothetical protein [Prevotella sp.]